MGLASLLTLASDSTGTFVWRVVGVVASGTGGVGVGTATTSIGDASPGGVGVGTATTSIGDASPGKQQHNMGKRKLIYIPLVSTFGQSTFGHILTQYMQKKCPTRNPSQCSTY